MEHDILLIGVGIAIPHCVMRKAKKRQKECGTGGLLMANEMRDRLVELIETAKKEWWEKSGRYQTSKAEADYIADCLLDDGWVRPPCKVGDTVYYPWIYNGQCGIAFNEVESIKIYVNRLPIAVVEDWRSDMPMPICFTIEDSGKTVFLTKAEAEQKLKGKRGE